MKKLSIITICTLFFLQAFPQAHIEKAIPVKQGQELLMNLRFADNIKIKGWNKPEVLFTATVMINSGRLNDAFTLDIQSVNEAVRINSDIDRKQFAQARPEDCHNKHNSYWESGRQLCTDIQVQVMVPADVSLKVESISADIEITDVNAPIAAKSISGFLDISWPEARAAEVSFNTVTGEAYSDLNIDFANRKKNMQPIGYKLSGKIKEGGPRIELETVSSDIFLRKMR